MYSGSFFLNALHIEGRSHAPSTFIAMETKGAFCLQMIFSFKTGMIDYFSVYDS